LSAPNSARSAGVSAKSSTTQTSAQSLSWRQLETPERVVHITGIDTRVPFGDLASGDPESL
jgi:hypothetical protein